MTPYCRLLAVLLSLSSLLAFPASAQVGGATGAAAGAGAMPGGSALPNQPAAGAAANAASAVSIEGRVVNALNGAPLPRANLTVTVLQTGPRSAYPGGMVPRPPTFSAVSDAEGKFKFENLPPGRYQLSADKSGYVRQQYGSSGQPNSMTPLTGAAGDSLRGLEFKLMPQAIIAGKVLDENGEPLASAMVQALRQTGYFRQNIRGGGGANTNAIGEFLIGDLPPGRYILRAEDPRSRFNSPAAVAARSVSNESYVPTYYPGSTDEKAAAAITVNAGQEVRGIEIWLRKTSVYRISGQVFGLPTGRAERFQVSLQPAQRSAVFFQVRSDVATNTTDGKFEIAGVLSGSYYLSAMLYPSNGRPETVGFVPVTVTNSDIDGVAIQGNSAAPMTITGRVRMEGAANTKITGSVSLEPLMALPGSRFAGGPIQEDGTFQVENVFLGKYAVNVMPLPEGSYLKRITSGGADVVENGLDLSQPQALPPLEIRISPNAGTVSGVIKDGDDPRAGAYVTLFPEPLRPENQRLEKSATTDASAQFSFKGIAPGAYRLYAWQESFPLRIIEPADLQPYESYGVSVQVEEGASKQVELRVIPPP